MKLISDLITVVVMVIFVVVDGLLIGALIEPTLGEKKAAGALEFVFLLPLFLLGAFIGKKVSKWILKE